MVNRLTRSIVLKIHGAYIHECYEKGIYTVCTSSDFTNTFYNKISVIAMYKFFNEWKKSDKKLNISWEVGRNIEELCKDKNITVGIYTAPIEENELQSSKLGRIITEGINVSYKDFKIPDLCGHIYFPEDTLETIDILRSDCKNSGIDFILTFPKELVDEYGDYKEESFYDICRVDENGVYVKPDFINSYCVASQGNMNRITKTEMKKVLINK